MRFSTLVLAKESVEAKAFLKAAHILRVYQKFLPGESDSYQYVKQKYFF